MAAINCQSAYPLNSEKARPPGTCTEYLSCAARAMPPNTATDVATITIAGMLVLLISNTSPLDRRGARYFGRTGSLSSRFGSHEAMSVRPRERSSLATTDVTVLRQTLRLALY